MRKQIIPIMLLFLIVNKKEEQGIAALPFQLRASCAM
jgi:hypothetical protein